MENANDWTGELVSIPQTASLTLEKMCVVCEEAAYVACPHRGQGTAKLKRGYDYRDKPTIILSARRPARGKQYIWDPFTQRLNGFPGKDAGIVHITRNVSKELIQLLIKYCPDLYMVSTAPSQRQNLERNLAMLGSNGIGVCTVRIKSTR